MNNIYGKKKFLLLLLVGFMAVTGAGCSRSEKTQAEQDRKVYYLNAERTTILPFRFSQKAEQTEEEIAEILEKLETAPVQLYASPLEGIAILSYTLDGGNLTLDFGESYLDLQAVDETLVRAAVVKSLCEIPEIKNVFFTVKGEKLLDSEKQPVGRMNGEMFIFNTGKEISSYEKIRLLLYFADESGKVLRTSYRNMVYNSNMPLERVIAEQVIRGPESDTSFPTINPETRILNITTKDGVCYLNLSDSFLTEPYNVSPQVAVDSLVNSLTELIYVDRVQISVEGVSNPVFMGNIPLSNIFERSMELVEEKEEP